jgi:hypothetical protein
MLPLALALLLAPAEPGATVRWHAPQGCPGPAALTERIELLLQRPLDPSLLALDAEIFAEPGGFRIELEVVVAGIVDRRSLVAAECETLTDSAALIAAVLLDPIATAETTEVAAIVSETVGLPDPRVADPTGARPRRGIRRADKPVGPDVVEPEAPRPRPPRDRELVAWTRVRSGAQFGAVPGVTGGFELAIGLGTRRVRGELAGSYWIGRRVPARAGIDTGAIRVHLGAITPRFCATAPQRRIDVIACGGLEIGLLRTALADGSVRTPVWLAIVAEAGIRAPITGRLSIWVSAMAFVPAWFPVLRLEDRADPARTAEVYRPAPAGVRGLLGLEVRLRGLDKRP